MMLEKGVLLGRVSSSGKNLGLKGNQCVCVRAYVVRQVPGDVFSEIVLILPDFFITFDQNRNASQIVV